MGKPETKRALELRAAAEAELRMAGLVEVPVWGLRAQISFQTRTFRDYSVGTSISPGSVVRGSISQGRVVHRDVGSITLEAGALPVYSMSEENVLRAEWLKRFKHRLGISNSHARTCTGEEAVSALLYARSQQAMYEAGLQSEERHLSKLRGRAERARRALDRR